MSEFQSEYGNNNDNSNNERIVIVPKSRSKAWSVAAFVVSILSITCCCLGWFGAVCGVLGVVFAVISRRSLGYFDGLSIAAIIVSIFGVAFSALILYVGYMLENNAEFMEYYNRILDEFIQEEGIEIFRFISIK